VALDFDLEPEFLELYERCRDQSMASIERMYALYQSVDHIVSTGLTGDFAECGVWRGGSVMMMALTLLQKGATDRQIWLYDTFDGMTAPTLDDVQAMSGEAASAILASNPRDDTNPFWGVAARRVVEANLQQTGYPMHLFHWVEGDVLATLPEQAPEQIALLRLDTDWYASTRHELECLYPRLQVGGVIIIDDYGYWTGARKAVDGYLEQLDEPPFLSRIDYTGRLAIKR
jgi:O-methyltransferase